MVQAARLAQVRWTGGAKRKKKALSRDRFAGFPSHRGDRNAQQVVYQANFFLDKGLGVFDSCKRPIKTGHRLDPRADLL